MVTGHRDQTEKNHTSTHLANWACHARRWETMSGKKGRWSIDSKLRFDFIHTKAMADEVVHNVEMLVNGCIDQKLRVYAEVAPQELAPENLSASARSSAKNIPPWSASSPSGASSSTC